MRMQPKFTEALFMVTADGLLQGHDFGASGPDCSWCLESNQTPVTVMQTNSVCSHQHTCRELIKNNRDPNRRGFQCIMCKE